MKLLVAACALACLPLAAQELKHLVVPTVNGIRPVDLSALSIERGAQYPSVIELKGNVEVRTPICFREKDAMSCIGESILHADEAVFHEDTGEVEARGKVTVTPFQYGSKNLGPPSLKP